MAVTALLKTYGYWGDRARDPFVYDIDTVDLKRQAQLGMGHGLSAAARQAQPYQRGVRRLYGDSKAPLCLIWDRGFRDDWNIESAWGGGTYLKRLQGAFGGNAYVLSHEQNLATQNVTYTSTFPLLRNQPWSLRMFVFKAVENAQQAIVSVKFDRWLIQVVGSKTTIARLAPTWTQSAQNDADVLVGALEADSDSGWNAAIDEFRNAHYEAFESIGGDTNLDAGNFVDLEIIPEPLGALTVLSSSARSKVDSTRIEIPALIEASDLDPNGEQTIIAPGAISVNTKGPSLQFQVGEHLSGNVIGTNGAGVSYRGQVLVPSNFIVNSANAADNLSDLYSLTRVSAPGGSGVTVSMEDKGAYGYNDDGTPTGLHKYEFSLILSAPDQRYTPFLYSGQVVRPALPHVGENSAQNYSSDDYPLDPSNPSGPRCIQDVSMTTEGEGWARKATVSFLDPLGKALKLSPLYEAQENRLATLQIGGVYVIRNGLVASADRGNMTTTVPGQDGAMITKVESVSVLNVVDPWYILDEMEEMSPLVLDGLYLGDASRRILRDAGFSDTEASAIPLAFGQRIPQPRLGEDAVVKCSGSPGAMLRQIYEDYGMGAIPYVTPATGYWTVATPTTAPVRSFVRTPYNSADCMFGTLDYSRDYSQCYNEITVIGGVNVRGEKLERTWTLRAGFQTGYADGFANGAYSQVHIGRKKRKVIRRPELRTADQVMQVLRSQVLMYGKSGRFVSFEIYADWTLRPGMPVLVEGRKYTVVKLGDCQASAHVGKGKMVNVYREESMAV